MKKALWSFSLLANANKVDFYAQTHNVYDDGSPVWDFTTPVWYEYNDDYPQFTRENYRSPLPAHNTVRVV